MEVINSVTMLSIVLTGAALIREREHGAIEHLLVMPVTPFEIMTAKVWAMALVVLAACAFSLIFVVQGWLAVPIEGSIALFLAGAAMHLFATTSMGIFLGTIARSMQQFGLLLILVLLPLQMLSVGSTPRERKRAAVIAPSSPSSRVPLPPRHCEEPLLRRHRETPLFSRHREERSDVAIQEMESRRAVIDAAALTARFGHGTRPIKMWLRV